MALGVVFLAHGYNHIFRGGRIAGTGRWFDSLGMRPGIVHAWLASVTELGAGALLLFGLATPLACAGVIGTMLVAWITNHLRNGFFIFRPGEGYEYVMTLTFAAVGLAGVGPGEWSVDHAVGWFQPSGWPARASPSSPAWAARQACSSRAGGGPHDRARRLHATYC